MMNIGIQNITIKNAGEQWLPNCSLTDLYQKKSRMWCRSKDFMPKHQDCSLTFFSRNSLLPPPNTRCCETSYCHGRDVFLLEKRWLVW